MALETAIGPISKPEQLLADTIANATHFLTFTGEVTVPAASAHIYFDALPEPDGGADRHSLAELEAYRPFVIVYTSPLSGLRMVRKATGNMYEASGTMIARFERTAPSGETLEESERSFKNAIGKLLKRTTESDPFDGVLDQAQEADRLTIERMTVAQMYRADDNELASMGDYQTAVVEFVWGPNS